MAVSQSSGSGRVIGGPPRVLSQTGVPTAETLAAAVERSLSRATGVVRLIFMLRHSKAIIGSQDTQ